MIEIKSRRAGYGSKLMERITDHINKNEPVFVCVSDYRSALQMINYIQSMHNCIIKLSWNTNLSNPRLSNEKCVLEGWELHQDDQWGIYARRLTGFTVNPQ
jgi:hypothetical protein